MPVVLLLVGAACRMHGQVTSATNPISQDPFNGAGVRSMGGMGGGAVTSAPSNLNGFGLFSVSGYGGYATYPSFDPVASKFSNIGSSMTGATASMGFGKVIGERTRFSLVYAPGVTIRPSDLSRSRANHTLALSLAQGLTPRLSLSIGLNASYSEFDQFAFQPAQFSQITSAPGSFDDLANALTGGQFSNSQIASLLTGAPVLESAARASLYGNQALTAAASVRLGYQMSPRLSIGFSVGGNRYQSVGIKGDDLGRNAVVPITNGLNGSIRLNYALTQRTSIGATLGVSRTTSRFVSTSYMTYTGNVSQRFTQRVIGTVSLGSGNSIHSNTKVNLARRYLVSGSLAVQASPTQTVMVQVNRTFVDDFGLGLRSTQSVTGSWSYAPLTSPVSFSIYTGYQNSSLTANHSLSSFFTGAGVNRKLSPGVGISGQFFYTRSNNTLGQIFGGITQGEFERTGVRAVITWFPRPIEY